MDSTSSFFLICTLLPIYAFPGDALADLMVAFLTLASNGAGSVTTIMLLLAEDYLLLTDV